MSRSELRLAAPRAAWISALGWVGLLSCTDPPPPPPAPDPVGVPRWSTAPHVRWSSPGDPVQRPLAVFVGRPGARADTIAADPDVTTFVNDRFHGWFLSPESTRRGATEGEAVFLDQGGCLLVPPAHPTTASAWLALANTAALAAHRGEHLGPLLPGNDPVLFELPPEHPLRGECPAGRPALDKADAP